MVWLSVGRHIYGMSTFGSNAVALKVAEKTETSPKTGLHASSQVVLGGF